MRRFSQRVTSSAGGQTKSGVYVPDVNVSPFNIAIGVAVNTTAKYTVQHTFTDPTSVDLNTSATWLNHEFLVNASANSDGNYAFPVTGIRVIVSAASEGSVDFTLIQAG